MLNQKQIRLTVVWRYIWTWLQNSRHLLASFSLPQQNLSRKVVELDIALNSWDVKAGCTYHKEIHILFKGNICQSRFCSTKVQVMSITASFFASPLRVGIWANYATLLRDLLFPITLQWHWQGWMAQLEAGDWTYPWQPLGWNITSFKAALVAYWEKETNISSQADLFLK